MRLLRKFSLLYAVILLSISTGLPVSKAAPISANPFGRRLSGSHRHNNSPALPASEAIELATLSGASSPPTAHQRAEHPHPVSPSGSKGEPDPIVAHHKKEHDSYYSLPNRPSDTSDSDDLSPSPPYPQSPPLQVPHLKPVKPRPFRQLRSLGKENASARPGARNERIYKWLSDSGTIDDENHNEETAQDEHRKPAVWAGHASIRGKGGLKGDEKEKVHNTPVKDPDLEEEKVGGTTGNNWIGGEPQNDADVPAPHVPPGSPAPPILPSSPSSLDVVQDPSPKTPPGSPASPFEEPPKTPPASRASPFKNSGDLPSPKTPPESGTPISGEAEGLPYIKTPPGSRAPLSEDSVDTDPNFPDPSVSLFAPVERHNDASDTYSLPPKALSDKGESRPGWKSNSRIPPAATSSGAIAYAQEGEDDRGTNFFSPKSEFSTAEFANSQNSPNPSDNHQGNAKRQGGRFSYSKDTSLSSSPPHALGVGSSITTPGYDDDPDFLNPNFSRYRDTYSHLHEWAPRPDKSHTIDGALFKHLPDRPASATYTPWTTEKTGYSPIDANTVVNPETGEKAVNLPNLNRWNRGWTVSDDMGGQVERDYYANVEKLGNRGRYDATTYAQWQRRNQERVKKSEMTEAVNTPVEGSDVIIAGEDAARSLDLLIRGPFPTERFARTFLASIDEGSENGGSGNKKNVSPVLSGSPPKREENDKPGSGSGSDSGGKGIFGALSAVGDRASELFDMHVLGKNPAQSAKHKKMNELGYPSTKREYLWWSLKDSEPGKNFLMTLGNWVNAGLDSRWGMGKKAVGKRKSERTWIWGGN